jgi:hypothetical protein
VHGLAFAGALTELHLDAAHLALALLGFNLGIEVMQLAVVAATFPWLLLLAQTGATRRFSSAAPSSQAPQPSRGSASALGLPNPLDADVTAAAARPTLLLSTLALVVLVARVHAMLSRRTQIRTNKRKPPARLLSELSD